MKKLLIIAFSLLATIAFCAEKTVNMTTSNGTTTTQMTQSNPVMTTTSTVSLGDSFMTAFGMSGNTTAGGSSEGGSGSSSSGSSSTGSISSALNVSTTIANGSVTIATPYGNAMHK
jgi:hypothetical protein